MMEAMEREHGAGGCGDHSTSEDHTEAAGEFPSPQDAGELPIPPGTAPGNADSTADETAAAEACECACAVCEMVSACVLCCASLFEDCDLNDCDLDNCDLDCDV